MSETKEPRVPRGELVMRTMAMPADTNANGDVFGGWLMSQMDIGGAVLARTVARSRVVTVAVEAMSFHRPVLVGDTVTCFAHVNKIGRTSIRVDVEVWVQHYLEPTQFCVTEGVFTYVAIDEQRKPRPIRHATAAPPT